MSSSSVKGLVGGITGKGGADASAAASRYTTAGMNEAIDSTEAGLEKQLEYADQMKADALAESKGVKDMSTEAMSKYNALLNDPSEIFNNAAYKRSVSEMEDSAAKASAAGGYFGTKGHIKPMYEDIGNFATSFRSNYLNDFQPMLNAGVQTNALRTGVIEDSYGSKINSTANAHSDIGSYKTGIGKAKADAELGKAESYAQGAQNLMSMGSKAATMGMM